MRPSPGQVLVLIFIWCVTLITYDRVFNKHLLRPKAADIQKLGNFAKPEIRLSINHLCCTGCWNVTRDALKSLPWLAEPQTAKDEKLITKEEANQKDPSKEAVKQQTYSGAVVAEVEKLQDADFVKLREVLRKAGMYAGQIRFGGVPHFALRADLSRHLCCPLCREAVEKALTPKKDEKFGSTLQWLDSSNVSLSNKTATAYVKTNTEADVSEFLHVLDEAGLPPASVRIVVGDNA